MLADTACWIGGQLIQTVSLHSSIEFDLAEVDRQIAKLQRRIRRTDRHGFFKRLYYGVVLPIGVLTAIAVFQYVQQTAGLQRSAENQSSLATLQKVFAFQAMLVFPTAIGLCFRLILRRRRQTRLTLFVKGLIAAAIGVGIGLFMFHVFVSVLTNR